MHLRMCRTDGVYMSDNAAFLARKSANQHMKVSRAASARRGMLADRRAPGALPDTRRGHPVHRIGRLPLREWLPAPQKRAVGAVAANAMRACRAAKHDDRGHGRQ